MVSRINLLAMNNINTYKYRPPRILVRMSVAFYRQEFCSIIKQTFWNSFGRNNRERQYNLNCFSSISFPHLQLNSKNNLHIIHTVISENIGLVWWKVCVY